tara:strand:- start:179 stop:742 length:564 start_codon:yes stop_codon:yes gene_type:complete
MSLSPKQIRDLNNLYESIYTTDETEFLTEEEINELWYTEEELKEGVRLAISDLNEDYTEEEIQIVEEVILEVVKTTKKGFDILNKLKGIGSKLTGFGLKGVKGNKNLGLKRRILSSVAGYETIRSPGQLIDKGHGGAGGIAGLFSGAMRGSKGEKIKLVQTADGRTYDPSIQKSVRQADGSFKIVDK